MHSLPKNIGLNNSSYCELNECVDSGAFNKSSERYVGESTYLMLVEYMRVRNQQYVSFS